MTSRPFPPPSTFAADDGSADPQLALVLAAYRAGLVDLHAVQRALLTARLLVPVVSVVDDLGETAEGSPFDKTSHISSVTVEGRDGRRAQPVFTSIAALVAWNPQARPFPRAATEVARGAYADGAVALLVDIAGPVEVVLEGPPMLALAEGRVWVPPVEDPDVLAAVGDALAGLPGLTGVDVGASVEADLTLTLHVPGAIDGMTGMTGMTGMASVDGAAGPPRDFAHEAAHEAAREVAHEAAQRLAAVDLLRLRLQRGLDLAVTPS